MTERKKVTIDQASLTFAELADIEEQLGMSLSQLFDKSQARGMAAIVWVTLRRENAEFTYNDALQFGPTDIENLDDLDPEALGASDGAKPPTLVAPGASTPSA